MEENTSAPAAPRPMTSLLGGVIAGLGALAMGSSLSSLRVLAQTSTGPETLIAWVLQGVAALGVLLCLYLAVIWFLAATIVMAGPASRTGAALLGPLRVLAPRLARRLVGGAAVATATTALALAPAVASQYLPESDSAARNDPASRTTQLLSTETPTTDPAPEAGAPAGGSARPGGAGTPLPPLGWGDATQGAPDSTGAAPVDAASDGEGPGSPAAGGTEHPSPRTVVVRPGDSLWSISEDLLGPGSSDPGRVAAAWPLLHQENRGVIGDDPDRLRPGQELTIPDTLTTQDMP